MAGKTGRSRVLVVEDKPWVAALFEEWLTDEYDVRAVHSGGAALDAMAETEADIVLLDRQLLGLSGDEVAYRFAEEGYSTQVIMLTAVESSSAVATLPVDECLCKPVGRDELSDTVETAEIVATYEARITELFCLAVRRHVLEKELSANELDNSQEFRRLTDRIAALRHGLDQTIDELRRHADTDIFARLDSILNSRG